MKLIVPKILLLLMAIVIAPSLAFAQDLISVRPRVRRDPALPAAVRDLAQRVLPVYQENDQDRYLSNLSALQMVAGDPGVSPSPRASPCSSDGGRVNGYRPVGRALVYDIYARAQAIESQVHLRSAMPRSLAFRDAVNLIEDLDAHVLERQLTTPTAAAAGRAAALARSAPRQDQHRQLDDAIDLVWAWFAFEAYQFQRGRAAARRCRGPAALHHRKRMSRSPSRRRRR